MRDDSEYFRYRYSEEIVAKLLGLREEWGSQGRRHVTIVDLLSWAQDPGGDAIWYRLALGEGEAESWMARRGPLAPDGELATVLWDLQRAMRYLSLKEQAVIALTVFGFRRREVAKTLGMSVGQVHAILWGDPRREGAVCRITARMNGNRPA